jgi:hypothetical protein
VSAANAEKANCDPTTADMANSFEFMFVLACRFPLYFAHQSTTTLMVVYFSK